MLPPLELEPRYVYQAPTALLLGCALVLLFSMVVSREGLDVIYLYLLESSQPSQPGDFYSIH